DEDVSRLIKLRRWAEPRAVQIHAIRSHAVGSSIDQKWVSTGGVLRHVYRGEQMHSVTHRDPVLVFCVMFLDVILRRLGFVLGGKIGDYRRRDENQHRQI